ncbi:hypothetical protein B0T10DRAFT_563305 [Thelonectria olida]|uniref:Uncharacterized protein n=1 Tax=Thelonectria olida TaxID=1576542 RepID=A0A9P9ANU8_9HYPO|nr:hypothetical protein B0T10DRAFT_563305 [Thelonectria olida]
MGVLRLFKIRHKAMQIAIIAIYFLVLTGFLFQLHSRRSLSIPGEGTEVTGLARPPIQKPLVKPEGVIVSGLIFYGRESRVSSMRCYLERNLVDNGGWLDEVLWIVNTQNEQDLRYLDEIIARSPTRHKKVIPEEHLWTYTYYKAWRHLERGKYYVKIDDDIVWFDDNAIPNLVTRKINHPDSFVVAGNIINNPPLGFMHFRMGALHPYFPEPEQASYVTNSTDYWKPSRHGFWDGPNNFTWDIEQPPPAWPNHRWLRVQHDTMIDQTPVAQLKYEVWGPSYQKWSIAAQMHYSLLENIENDALDLYMFEKLWIMYGDRIRINFMCVYADDILDTDPENWPRNRGDEDMIVLDLPEKLRRPVVIQGNALAAHFQYADQGDLEHTDLLKRYRALAHDRYCLNATSKWL